jgi:hypothetical protein
LYYWNHRNQGDSDGDGDGIEGSGGGGLAQLAGLNHSTAETALSPLFHQAGAISVKVQTIASNADSCLNAILDFQAGMLCMACSPNHEGFVKVDANNTLHLNLDAGARYC